MAQAHGQRSPLTRGDTLYPDGSAPPRATRASVTAGRDRHLFQPERRSDERQSEIPSDREGTDRER